MLSGDYLIRQVHQLAQVLARALLRRQTEDVHEVLADLRTAWSSDPAFADAHPADLDEAPLIEACSIDGRLHAERALVVADLLAAEADLMVEAGQRELAARPARRARWLYTAARRDPSAVVPMDLYDRIDRLEQLIAGGREG